MVGDAVPRPHRKDAPGAWHHVIHRGARRAPIFKVSSDCQIFLDTVAEMVGRYGVEVHAYSLMPNHYHLLVRSQFGNLSQAMRHLNGTFTQRMNRRHSWDGPVFRGRFRSELVRRDAHLRYLVAYLHLNPVRAHLVKRLTDEAWTSHRAYAQLEPAAAWLSTAPLAALFGTRKRLVEFVQSVHLGRKSWPAGMDLEEGWYPGADEDDEGGEALETVAQRPEELAQLLKRVCELCGVVRADIMRAEHGPRANPARRFAAWALSQRPGTSYREIARALGMSVATAAKTVARARGGTPEEPLRSWMRAWSAPPSS